MKAKSRGNRQVNFLYPDLLEQLNPAHPLLKLANRIPWQRFEDEFSNLYSQAGRPAKPIRLMVGLMLLKQLENLSDERVVEAWVANPYFQAFCGETRFQWKLPCNPSYFVYFRKRISEDGARLIFEVSVALHGDDAKETEVTVDTTVQEKNITFPTDTKLMTKIIKRCRKIAADEGIRLRRSFRRELPGLLLQRFKSNRIIKRIRTMAGVLIRELERKLPRAALARHGETLQLFRGVHKQKRMDKNKVYSLHEPDVLCIGKGKEHKKYEFGRKASIVVTKTTGVIVGALSFTENIYDGKTLPSVLEQAWQITETCPKVAICDRGYRGRTRVGDVEIVTPPPRNASSSQGPIPETSRYRTNHWTAQGRSPDGEEFPHRRARRRHQSVHGRRCLQPQEVDAPDGAVFCPYLLLPVGRSKGRKLSTSPRLTPETHFSGLTIYI